MKGAWPPSLWMWLAAQKARDPPSARLIVVWLEPPEQQLTVLARYLRLAESRKKGALQVQGNSALDLILSVCQAEFDPEPGMI